MSHYYYILNEQGDPVPCDSSMEWALWFEYSNRQVALDERGDVRVSTVFLGLDHSFNHGPPLLFETMVFGGPEDEAQERYTTRAEALVGHAAWVLKVLP